MSLEDALRMVKSAGYSARVETSDVDAEATVTIWGGDCNCPHAKPYDPKDGHGFTSVTLDTDRAAAASVERALTIARSKEGLTDGGFSDTELTWISGEIGP